MRAILLRAALVLVGATFAASSAKAKIEVEFIPASSEHEPSAAVYQWIWHQYGERIIAAFESRTCMPFTEPKVWALVDEAVSHSGGPEHPMRLRASYFQNTKKSTLVHELGHRHLWQLAERLDDIDGHMTLYLVLDRVWADVWGEEFAESRVQGESSWHAAYDYEAAWSWARSLDAPERTRIWNELLGMNGFPASCDGLVKSTSSRQ